MMDEQQQGETRHHITLSTAHTSGDEESPLDNENLDVIEDYEQHAEGAYHDDYPSKDCGGEDEEDGDFELVQPYKDFVCGSWAAGRGPAIAFAIIAAYSIWAFVVDFQRALPLFIVEMIVLGIALTSKATDLLVPERKADLQDRTVEFCTETLPQSKIAALLCLAILAVVTGVMVDDPRNLVSLFGLVVFIAFSWSTSYKPREVRWGPVLSGVLLQFITGALVMKVDVVARAFAWLGDQVTILLGYTTAGSTFVYGYLDDKSLGENAVMLADGSTYFLSPPFYFSILSVVFFFSALVSILHYLGAVGFIVKRLGIFLGLLMGTSPIETFNCIANMFLSMTEAPLLIKPALADATESELHAVMTAGFASVAGAVLAAYISFGANASDLLAATVMSAPAALAISKLVYPETRKNGVGNIINFEMAPSEETNIIGAAVSGASLAVHMVLEIGGQLIAVIALVAMVDGFLAGIGSLIDVPLSFATITSYLFYPVAWLMGVPPDDCLSVGTLIGTKIIVNEFAGFYALGKMIEEGTISDKAATIATFALCGFSNIASIGITSAVVGTMIPNKKHWVTKLASSAMIAGNTACLMTAAIAGLFYSAEVHVNNNPV